MKKTFFIFTLLFGMFFYVQAQKAVVGIPYSFSHSDVSLNIDEIVLPEFDHAQLAQEDAQHQKDGSPMRIGVSHHVGYTFDNCGRTDILKDGAKLWRLKLTSPGALSMAVYCDQFDIPEGAMLHLYSGDRSQLTGTYTNADIQHNGLMVTEDIDGEEIILEYYEPADVLYHGKIHIARISHRYYNPTFNEKALSGSCHINTNCPEGEPWLDQINSVVRIEITTSIGESYLCSGALINNTSYDKTPYVLSAHHCLNDDYNSSFQFYFKYETADCDVYDYGLGNRRVRGGVVVASDNMNSSDFLLLRITGNISSTISNSIFFAGWDVSGAASVGIAIHHPAGDFKKLSFPKTINSYYSYPNYWNVSWYVNPNRGCTEQGSSGSPLFNASGLIIGDLSNGESSCETPWGTDNYGKISRSWTNNNHANTAKKLKPWLDPLNTGVTSIPGMRYDGTIVGIEDRTNMEMFTITPNPSSGIVHIQGDFDSENGVCRVFNTLGKQVAIYDLQLSPSFSMNLNDLSNGIYILEIQGDRHLYKSKLVIAR